MASLVKRFRHLILESKQLTATRRICHDENHVAPGKVYFVLFHVYQNGDYQNTTKQLAVYARERDGPIIFRLVPFPFLEHRCRVV